MLIDDDEPTNFLNEMFIEEADCTEKIKVTESGNSALNYLISAQRNNGNGGIPYPDLIFLDINMPAMNGWEFIEKYKEINKEYKSKTIIIILSTTLNPDDVLKANLIPEIFGFENKPLTNEKLNRILLKYFAGNF